MTTTDFLSSERSRCSSTFLISPYLERPLRLTSNPQPPTSPIFTLTSISSFSLPSSHPRCANAPNDDVHPSQPNPITSRPLPAMPPLRSSSPSPSVPHHPLPIHPAPGITALSLLSQHRSTAATNPKVLPTQCKAIDHHLLQHGGFDCGSITTISGAADSGASLVSPSFLSTLCSTADYGRWRGRQCYPIS